MHDKEKRKDIEFVVLGVVYNIYGQIALIYVPKHEKWMLPGGHLEFDEKREKAVFRENLEEIELKIRNPVSLLRHDIIEKGNHRVYEVFECTYIGEDFKELFFDMKEGIEKVKWFYPKEINKILLSEMAILGIEKSRDKHRLDSDFLQWCINQAQSVLFATRVKAGKRSKSANMIEKATMKYVQKLQEYIENDPVYKKSIERGTKKTRKAKQLALVVEDDEQILRLLGSILEKIGYGVITFENPLNVLKDLDLVKKISLGIINYNLSEMSGTDLIKKIKKINPLMKTILLSGYSRDGIKGYKGRFLQKPIISSDLLKEIKNKKIP